MMKKVFVIISVLVLVSSLSAQTISVLSKDSGIFGEQTPVVDSSGVLLSSGNWVQIGFYDTSSAGSVENFFNPINSDTLVSSSELSAMLEAWSPFVSTESDSGGQIGGSGGDGTFAIVYGGAVTAGTIFENNKVFLTIFETTDGSSNIGSNWENVTEIGVFSSPSWSFGSLVDPFSGTKEFYNSEVTEFLVGSSGSLMLAAVPEPSTYASIFGIFALGVVVLRRRRR